MATDDDPQPVPPAQWLADLTHQWGPPRRHDINDEPPPSLVAHMLPVAQREQWLWHRDSIGYIVKVEQAEPSRLNETGQAARWEVTLQSFGAQDMPQVVHFTTAEQHRPDDRIHQALALAGWLIHPALGTPAAKCVGCGMEREYTGIMDGSCSGEHRPGCPVYRHADGLPMRLVIGNHGYELGKVEIALLEYDAPRVWLPLMLHDIAARIDGSWERQVAEQGGDQEGGRT